jgi:hypothetical protein
MSELIGFFRKSRRGKLDGLALSSLVMVLAAVAAVGNIFSIETKQPWVAQRADFNPADTLQNEHNAGLRSEFAPVLFIEKLSATNYLCVDENNVYYPFLTSHQGLTGIEVDSSCTPLDFTDRPGDNLHPELITAPIAKSFLYYAFVPGLDPTSDTAILVEAHGDVFVLVNVDTLHHLGINTEAAS